MKGKLFQFCVMTGGSGDSLESLVGLARIPRIWNKPGPPIADTPMLMIMYVHRYSKMVGKMERLERKVPPILRRLDAVIKRITAIQVERWMAFVRADITFSKEDL